MSEIDENENQKIERVISQDTAILLTKINYFENNSPILKHVKKEVELHPLIWNKLAPSQTKIQKFLREKYNLQVYAYSHTLKSGKWGDYIAVLNSTDCNDARDEEFQIYEDALEFGLKCGIEKVIKRLNLTF